MPCVVSYIYLCLRERLALRLDLRKPPLLMQSPFHVQLVHRSTPCVSSCGAVCAVCLFLIKEILNMYELLNIRASKDLLDIEPSEQEPSKHRTF